MGSATSGGSPWRAWVLGLAAVTCAPRQPLPAAAPTVSAVTAPPEAAPRDAGRDSLHVTEAEYRGWRYYHVYCDRCHAQDAMGSSFAPDLRRSVSAEGGLTGEAFIAVVRDGSRSKAMPAFNAQLDDKRIEEVYAYVKARSDGRLAAGRPHRAATGP